MHRSRCSRRLGFTLVEILVVVAIIGILAALTAGATMQVIGNQKKSNTEQTVAKVAAVLDKQWKAVIAQAKEEPIPDAILNGVLTGPPQQQFWGLIRMASLDPTNPQPNDLVVQRRARVIWIGLRLKQQFPMNFMEALDPTPRTVAFNGRPYLLLPPESAYCKALLGVPVPLWWSTMPGQTPPPVGLAAGLPQSYESSVCLLLALSRSRGGSAFNQENLSSAELAGSGVNGLKMIVDAWGRPLTFYRWPIRGEIAASDPYRETTAAQVVIRNPLDPDAVLMQPDRGPTQPGWNSVTRYSGMLGVWAFEKLFYPVHDLAGASYQPLSYYSVPVVGSTGASAGSVQGGHPYLTIDDMMGLPSPPNEIPPVIGLPDALRHDPMEMVNNVQRNSYDNIYSFRLRLGARGD
jgi:prepilin-type N-terminal cleavage/methylation domain-containing protein